MSRRVAISHGGAGAPWVSITLGSPHGKGSPHRGAHGFAEVHEIAGPRGANGAHASPCAHGWPERLGSS